MSFVREAVRQSRLIVVRSLTKFHALPGLRVGYLVAHRAVASRLSEQLEPWSVNTLALIAAAESLQDVAYRHRLLALVQKEREYLFTKLQELGWLQPFPSAANFLLVRIKAQGMMTGTTLRLELEKHRILVRDASGFNNLGRQYVRIAVRRRRDNRMLIETLRTVGERRGLTARDGV
jgi:threonine-phosphate decarboxylase